MAVSRVNTKGQVTIPKALRERFGFRPGDEVEFIEVEGGLQV
jgi:AbrB family looped-hinge helix DNA binding protein